MPIIDATYYYVQCDQCGGLDLRGMQERHQSREDASEDAKRRWWRWRLLEGWFCPACFKKRDRKEEAGG